jgi:hypothetical protein
VQLYVRMCTHASLNCILSIHAPYKVLDVESRSMESQVGESGHSFSQHLWIHSIREPARSHTSVCFCVYAATLDDRSGKTTYKVELDHMKTEWLGKGC